jgi:hypothetical protein
MIFETLSSRTKTFCDGHDASFIVSEDRCTTSAKFMPDGGRIPLKDQRHLIMSKVAFLRDRIRLDLKAEEWFALGVDPVVVVKIGYKHPAKKKLTCASRSSPSTSVDASTRPQIGLVVTPGHRQLRP